MDDNNLLKVSAICNRCANAHCPGIGQCTQTKHLAPKYTSRCGGAGCGGGTVGTHEPKGDPCLVDCQPADVRSYNVGTSDYASHKIQPWDIWLDWSLNPWDADIVKRVLRDKEGEERSLDYEKIKHICDERLRQLREEKVG